MAVAAPAIVGIAKSLQTVWNGYKATGNFLTATTGIQPDLKSVDKGHLAAVITPAVGGVIASKVVKVGLNAAGKAAPMANKVLNAKLARV